MSHPFLHPQGRELLKRVAQAFRSDSVYILRDSNIVFVCGGPIDEPSMRQRFLKYGNTELPHLRMFLAESAEKDFSTNEEATLHDVGEFEEIIGEIADCLIIFPESPGSYAELGFFSKNAELSKKILVVNNVDLQGKDSFIRRGPISRIDAVSKFRTEIQVTYGDGANFGLIRERLENRVVGKNRKRFEAKKYSDLTPRNTFFAIFEIVRLFQVISLEGIDYAFKSIFAHSKPSELKKLLSILIAAEFVRRGGKDQQYFCINRSVKSFVEFDNFNEVLFRVDLADLYAREFPDIAAVVGGLPDDH
jgi:hypothetical protein